FVATRPPTSSASFVHAGDVYGACGRVAGDLDITNEWAGRRQLLLAPGDTVISRKADSEAPSISKVVPGDVHPPEEWTARVVVSPARLAVVREVSVNTKMRPTIWIRGIGGLVPADALTTAGCVKEDSKPSAAWLIVQSNRVAEGILERTLAVGSGETSEGAAAIGGN